MIFDYTRKKNRFLFFYYIKKGIEVNLSLFCFYILNYAFPAAIKFKALIYLGAASLPFIPNILNKEDSVAWS